MVSVVESIMSIEQADKLSKEEILKLENDGCRLVYLVDMVLIVREQIYQPKIIKEC